MIKRQRLVNCLIDFFQVGMMGTLMEPITYANGSTLEDPAITYGIVSVIS